MGVNESGTVVGQFGDSVGNGHGFTWDGGNLTQVDYPGSVDTALIGVNALGDFVGQWDNEIFRRS